mmetsp:Transcript_22767/g.54475  ORF Transcript_22767/g.54475 Transcript_22767/m.54475 type:complete len:263 (-) Transcript_22767:424-1212(-)
MHVAGLLRPAVLRLVLKRLATRHRLRRLVALVAAAGLRLRLAARLVGQLLVQVRRAVFMKRKEVAQLLGRHRARLDLLVGRDAGETLLAQLPLEDLLLDRAGAQHAVDVHALLLAIPPHARRRLLVVGGVPVRIEEDEPVGADQVEAAAARLGREEEDEEVGLRVVDLIDHLGTLLDRARAVELAARPPLVLAHALEEVERLRVVGDEHDAVVGGGAQFRQHLVQHVELARELRQHGGGLAAHAAHAAHAAPLRSERTLREE